MKIAIDIRALQIGHENRGIGSVVKSVLENIKDTENDYIFYKYSNSDPLRGLSLKLERYSVVDIKPLKHIVKKPSDMLGAFAIICHKFNALRPFKPDVFIQFDPQLMVPRWRKTKTICYAYDLIPLKMPSTYLPRPGMAASVYESTKAKTKVYIRSWFYRYKYKMSLKSFKRANSVLAVSEFTRQVLISGLRIKPAKITVNHLAPMSSQSYGVKKPLVDGNYLYYIGGTDSRKHIEDTVFALNLVNGLGYDMKLVLSGNELNKLQDIPDASIRGAIKNSPYQDKIILTGYANNANVANYYQHATAFLFMTYQEGFGLPIIEAQAAGCPVVTYNNSSVSEVSGENAAALVETGNIDEVVARIIELVEDTPYRKKLVENGRRNSKRFSWDKHVSNLLNIIRQK